MSKSVRPNRRRWAAALLGLFFFLAVGVPAIKNALNPPKPADATTTVQANQSCAAPYHTPVYFANQVNGTYRFGPALTGSTPQAQLQDLQSRYACDPSLLVATAHAFNVLGMGSLDSDTQTTAAIQQLVASPKTWEVDAYQLATLQNSAKLSATTQSGPYYTEGMIPQQGAPPLIRQYNPDRSAPVLVLTFSSGVVWYIETDCGGQPRFQQPFPGVPVIPPPSHQPAPPTTSTPPSGPPTTVPTCTSVYGPGYAGTYPNCYKPAQSFNCQQNGSWTPGCPPNQADQPPQVPGNPVQAANGPGSTTPGAPATQPTQSPAPPAGAGTGSGTGLPSNSGGYNTGSGTGSGTAGGTTCQPNTGCTSSSQTGGGGSVNPVGAGDGNATQGGSSGGSTSQGGGTVTNPFS